MDYAHHHANGSVKYKSNWGYAMAIKRHKFDEKQFEQLQCLPGVGPWLRAAIEKYTELLPLFLKPKGFPDAVHLSLSSSFFIFL